MTKNDFSAALRPHTPIDRPHARGGPPARERVRWIALVAGLLLAGTTESSAQTASSEGAPDGIVLLGLNGGVTTQVFSPGSVIILQNKTIPDVPVADLGGSASPEVSQGVYQRGRRLTFNLVETPAPGAPEITGFVEGFAYNEDQSETGTEQASDTTGRGGIVGLSVAREAWSVSLALDHFIEETTYESGTFGNFQSIDIVNPFRYSLPFPGAELDRKETGLTLAGSYRFPNGLQAFGGARIGRINLETQREYFELGSVEDPVSANPADNIEGRIDTRGETEGVSTTLSGGLAYASALGNGFVGGITGSLTWTQERLDGFEETTPGTDPDGDVRTRYGEDLRISVLSRLGVSVSRPIRAGQGAVIVPDFRAAWLHEFADDSREIDVSTQIELPMESFEASDQIETNDPDRDYFTLGFGLSAFNTDGTARLYVDFEQILGHDFIDAQTVRVGGQIKF